ncbi:MAG TPA: protein kinase [Kofleriaceae bacterium]|nr:protein kinase [Kofleriaceae bacterium]
MGSTFVTDGRPQVRLARALASPVGVLVTLPLLVVAVGLGIFLVGRDATRTSSLSLARHQLAEQAIDVQEDVAFALDQADPLLERLRVLADPQRPIEDVLPRMYDLIVGRPGIAYLSISFPDGTFRGAYLTPDKHVEVQESRLDTRVVHRFAVEAGSLRLAKTEPNDYDPRTRGFYQLAQRRRARAWTEPYTFFKSHETGITCTEPLYDGNTLRAVLTVDFDVGALSSFVARPAMDQARSVVYTKDGTMLAYPAADQLSLPASDKLLRHEDLKDPALDALLDKHPEGTGLQLVELPGALASVAPIGGKRAGVDVPLDWYVATIVPTHTLLGATRRLERSSILASAGALAIAVGLALVLAWNLVRMRRQVKASREEARSAEARAREMGSYRLVARLGAGGMGEVWRAEHRLLARSAAIKLIRPEALRDEAAIEEMRERFRREAQTLASMKSRHTIQIFDYGVTNDGIFYYVMELLDGLDLESLVVRYGAQPAARVIRLMEQACMSLAEAHDAGLLHRDIKPPNLFTCRAADEIDICKLLDFGIVQTPGDGREVAKPVSLVDIPGTPKLTQLGAMLGTPGFMAPEQILGMRLDGRADLYALGCVAWWLLAGREVFSREDGEAKVLHRHIYDEVPSLRDVTSKWIPDELERVIVQCLAKEPEDRPRDARTLAAMLRAIEIPAEHAWDRARATAWWAAYQPPKPAPNMPSAEVQVIMPGRTREQRPIEATDDRAIAQTIAGPTAQTIPGPGDGRR